MIERARYRQLHRRELKLLRSYLLRLPYECRGVYFKFIDVKRSSFELQHQYQTFVGSNQAKDQALNLKYADAVDMKKK